MNNWVVGVSAGLLAVSLGGPSLATQSGSARPSDLSMRQQVTLIAADAPVDQSALIKENRELLLTNRELARKIATKLGITSTGDVPTTGTPLEQNQILILQNQETFKAIALKVGATVPELTAIDAKDTAEKNHKLLLQNKSIVVEVLKKLEIPLAPPPDLSKGTFVDKNNILLKGNGAALAKIATKLDVK